MENMTYLNVSREQLLQDMQQVMRPKRFEHVLRVEQTALALVDALNLDVDRAAVSLAAVAHDFAKDLPLAEARELALRYQPERLDLAQCGSEIVHGPAAACLLQVRYGCTNQSVLNAIAGHTIGSKEMDLVAQVVYIADYIEPARDFDGVEEARRLAQHDLKAACWYKMTHTLAYLVAQRVPLDLGCVAVYNAWCQTFI